MSTLLAGEIGRLDAATSVTGASDKIPVYQNGALKYATPDQIALGQDAVVGPASATDNAIVRFDGTTGELVQNSAVTIADTTGAIVITGTGSATVSATTNQLVLGTTATTTINSVAPAASRVYAIRDAGASGSFVVGGGNTAISLTGTGGTSTGTMTTLSAQVTSASITTAGGATHVATITYTGIAATDIVFITKAGGTNSATEDYSYKAVCTTNTITVTLSNNTAATSLNGTVIFNILVVKV